jgi:hypothetical protein
MSPAPAAASAMLRPISWVVAVCSSTAAAMVVWNWSIRGDHLGDVGDRGDRVADVALDRHDPLPDLVGRLRRLLSQILDLAGHHREPLSGLAGAGGFDGGVEGRP